MTRKMSALRRACIATAAQAGTDLDAIMCEYRVGEWTVAFACREHGVKMPKRIRTAPPREGREPERLNS